MYNKSFVVLFLTNLTNDILFNNLCYISLEKMFLLLFLVFLFVLGGFCGVCCFSNENILTRINPL